jgi:hypothetical protein
MRAPRARSFATASVLTVAVAVGCSGGRTTVAPSRTSITGEVANVADGVAGLCQARQEAKADPRAARATYDARARAAIESAARALQPSYALQASTLTNAAERVDADLTADPPPASLTDNLGLLTGAMRESLARLGIVTRACEE